MIVMTDTVDIDKLNKEDGLNPVMLPSGSKFFVHKGEVQYFNDRVQRYQADNHFTNMSDLQDLDRLIVTELLVWRWGMWVSQKRDYWGDPIDENQWQKAIKDHSAEIRQLKKSLGLDKETRDKQKGEGSFEEYLKNLRMRAKEFGVMRNEQACKAIELFQQLKSLVILHNNCDEQERAEQHIRLEDLLDWIENTAIPEFDEIDEKFRQTSQRYWIAKQ